MSVWVSVWALTDGQVVGWLEAVREEAKVRVMWLN